MSENAEATEAKVAKKKPAKKAAKKPAAKKAAVRKPAAKKAATKRAAKPATAAAPATKKRGRPAAKKAATKRTGTRRGKKGAKQFAYILLNVVEGETKASGMQGPFSTEADALADASIMAEDTTTIVLFRETKRGRVQKQTKFVAGR